MERLKPWKQGLLWRVIDRNLVNYEETPSLIVMLKSIRILLSIATHLDYKIWQMDVKTTFLNDFLRKIIIWYNHTQGSMVTLLILYVDDILLIGNDVEMLSSVIFWLSTQFQMKDLGEAHYVLEIKLLHSRKNKNIAY